MGAQPGLCSMGHNYCGVFPTITPNGDVFFCDNYEGSEDMFLGNLMDTRLPDLLFQPHLRHAEIRAQIMEVKQRCGSCEWFSSCGGGCPRYNRSASSQPFSQDNFFCNAYMRIMSHVSRRVKEITGTLEMGVS